MPETTTKSDNHKYWFRPKKFWGWFAAYYPVSWQGRMVSAAALILFVYSFLEIDKFSHSVSDTLINLVPPAVVLGILLDVVTRLKGEYPSWWRNGSK